MLNFLKLRASIGQLGNERIGSEFPYQASMEFSNGYLANKSYPEKRQEGECCYEFGIYSERKLAKDYDNWTPETIHQRAESLKRFINKRWSISFNNNDIFDKFIGLD